MSPIHKDIINAHFNIPIGSSNLLKILSALLVAFSHYYNLKAQTGYSLNTFEWCVRSQGGNIGVAVFFFLSGYGLMMSEMRKHLTLRMFLRKRFLKIYLPVILVTAIWLPISYVITSHPLSYHQIICDLIIGFRDPVLWFIKQLILLYAVFYLATIFIRRRKKLSLIILWTGTVGVCIVSYFTNGSFGLNSISGIPLFSVGVVSAFYSSKIYRGMNIALIPLILSFICISLTMYYHERFFANLVHVIADYLVVAAIILLCTRWNPIIRIPSILVLITFDIYLIHFKVLTVMKEVTPTLPILLFIVATITFSISLFLLRNRIIKL